MKKDKGYDPGFLSGVLPAASDSVMTGYLGDVDVVADLLRNAVVDVIEATRDNPEPAGVIAEIAERNARILLGEDTRGHTPLRKWNAPGGIDVLAAKWCGVSDEAPIARMVGAIATLFKKVFQLIQRSEGLLDEQWQPEAKELLMWYARLFVGLDPATQRRMGFDYDPFP